LPSICVSDFTLRSVKKPLIDQTNTKCFSRFKSIQYSTVPVSEGSTLLRLCFHSSHFKFFSLPLRFIPLFFPDDTYSSGCEYEIFTLNLPRKQHRNHTAAVAGMLIKCFFFCFCFVSCRLSLPEQRCVARTTQKKATEEGGKEINGAVSMTTTRTNVLQKQHDLRRHLEQQRAIDEAPTAAERLALQRARYRCGDRYIPASSIASWAETLAAAHAVADTSGMHGNLRPAHPSSRSGGGFSEIPAVAAGASGGGGWALTRALRASALHSGAGATGARGTVAAVAKNHGRFAGSHSLNSRVSLHRGDITRLEVDAIVCATDPSLTGGGLLALAVITGAGPLIEQDCAAAAPLEFGEAFTTRGYCLPAARVIHTSVPFRPMDTAIAGGVSRVA
jgi:hypothetical protein